MDEKQPSVQPERVGVEARLSRELLKPIVFGNHQRKFKIFTAVVTAGGERVAPHCCDHCRWREGPLPAVIIAGGERVPSLL